MKQRLLQLNLFLSEWKGRVPFTFALSLSLLGGLTMPSGRDACSHSLSFVDSLIRLLIGVTLVIGAVKARGHSPLLIAVSLYYPECARAPTKYPLETAFSLKKIASRRALTHAIKMFNIHRHDGGPPYRRAHDEPKQTFVEDDAVSGGDTPAHKSMELLYRKYIYLHIENVYVQIYTFSLTSLQTVEASSERSASP
ncbi:hypothetical protein EVAR_46835_1 [Eumeta japonica]|uniref:Uncharacterized protein n=1 Tax=Eumeta variegata TaxID=151549 RepID=A0A4C2A8Q0_EUMVA|nr:hypothetical protein EVAR_46835_1 [Eumeta japonica]